MQRSRARLFLLGLLGASSACFPSSTETLTTTGSTTTGTLSTTTTTTAGSSDTLTLTSVTVRPEDFLGPVPCSNNPGAMRSYVVTLKDLATAFTLASSPPVSCAESVDFRFVLPCQRYIAEVDGYAYYPSELTPVNDIVGGREMALKSAPSAKLNPGWTGSSRGCAPHDPPAADVCWPDGGAPDGGVTEGVLALTEQAAYVPFCEAIAATGAAASPPVIRVEPRDALGPFSCSAAGGTIASFDIVPEDASLAAAKGLPCDKGTTTYDAGLKDGVTYTFDVTTTTTAGATFHTACRAQAQAGRTVVAACEPLH